MRPILFQLPVLTGFSVSQALSGSASCRCCRSPLDHAEPRFASVTTSGPTWRSARAHGGGLTWFGHSVPFWHLHSYNRGWASLSPLLPSSPCSPPPCPPLPQSTCYSLPPRLALSVGASLWDAESQPGDQQRRIRPRFSPSRVQQGVAAPLWPFTLAVRTRLRGSGTTPWSSTKPGSYFDRDVFYCHSTPKPPPQHGDTEVPETVDSVS